MILWWCRIFNLRMTILCEKSWANIKAMRAILLLFEELSGLKVNFSKSLLVGVNVHGCQKRQWF